VERIILPSKKYGKFFNHLIEFSFNFLIELPSSSIVQIFLSGADYLSFKTI
jgi:hypothetical protein